MRSVVVLASYASSLTNFRWHLLAQFRARGYRVVACAPADPEVGARLAEAGVAFKAVGPERTARNPLSDIRYLIKIFRLLRSERPDVVLAYTIKPVIWGGIAARLCNVPERIALMTGLGFAFTANRPSILGRIVSRLLRIGIASSTTVVFQNPDDLGELREQGILPTAKPAIVVNGSGVDLDFFRPAAPARQPVFLVIARLLADKGIREYAEAAKIVRARYPDARFKLAGWFDDNPTAIAAWEIEGWVAAGDIEYLGVLDDVRPAIASCSVYVLPSYREGTPRTVLEAMAMARPIITTDVPGCRETVIGGINGLLAEARSGYSLALAIQSILEHPEWLESMGQQSRAIAERKYDARKVAEDMLDRLEL